MVYKRSTNDWAHFRILNQKRGGAGDMHLTASICLQVAYRKMKIYFSLWDLRVINKVCHHVIDHWKIFLEFFLWECVHILTVSSESTFSVLVRRCRNVDEQSFFAIYLFVSLRRKFAVHLRTRYRFCSRSIRTWISWSWCTLWSMCSRESVTCDTATFRPSSFGLN